MRKLIILIVILIVILGLYSGIQTYLPQLGNIIASQGINLNNNTSGLPQEKVKVVSEESVTINAVKKVGPSVVTVEEISSNSQNQQQSNPFFDPFGGMFGSPFGSGGGSSNGGSSNGGSGLGGSSNTPVAIGSGFIISSSGLIVTNKHVVSDPGTYVVITSNDKKYNVKQIYQDPQNDIAVVKINPADNPGQVLKPVVLGNSNNLQVGQFVVAIGTALGEFRNTVTTGVISGLGRGITAGSQFAGETENLSDVIQTSAAINPGNSGGPLINDANQVIGINTAVAQNGQNIGFALPINTVKAALQNFNQNGGKFTYPYLGVQYKIIDRNQAILYNVPQGAFIAQVVSGSPAESAGLQQGDIITKIDNQSLNTPNALSDIIAKKNVGQTVSITYWRNGNTSTISVTLGSAPNQ